MVSLTIPNVNFRLVEVSLPTYSFAGRLRTVPYSFASIKGNIQEETILTIINNFSNKELFVNNLYNTRANITAKSW